MKSQRSIHPDFVYLLDRKEQALIDLFTDLRAYILDIHPDGNEILYHTHALTAVFSTSLKLSDAYCLIPIYGKHLNLGFNKGTLLNDPHKLLTGTGNLMRHIPITQKKDYNNKQVKELIQTAVAFAINDMSTPQTIIGQTVSKIKK